jgi:hypothetical protein
LNNNNQQAQAQLGKWLNNNKKKIANDNYQAELDRINKKEIALIAAESKSGPLSDVDKSGTPDVLEISKIALEQNKANKDYQGKTAVRSNSRNKNRHGEVKIEREKLQVDRENQTNDLAIAKENAKGRAKAKPKTK